MFIKPATLTAEKLEWLNPKGFRAVVLILLISFLISAIAFTVYITGGPVFVWVQLMSIPIITAALFFNTTGGLIAGVIAGLSVGPFMPLYIPDGVPQTFFNWTTRLGINVLLGGVSGYMFDTLKEQYRVITDTHKKLELSLEELKLTQFQLIEKAKYELIGKMSAGVAHEVKNPLAIIQLGVDYMKQKASVVADKDLAEAVIDMDDAVNRADSVIKGLLDLSRSETLEFKETDINEVIFDSIKLVRHELNLNRVNVDFTPGNVPALLIDSKKICQVFINLFMNSIHAMHSGGDISVTSFSENLTQNHSGIQSKKVDDGEIKKVVIVEIQDSGSGIPDNIIKRIFEPFFTTKPVGKGTGLGLAVVKRIMELHYGSISAANRIDGGTVITLTFRVGGIMDEENTGS